MARYGLEDMLQLMRELRHPEHGCPWDCKQTFETVLPHTIEEAYEVADAIERGDMEDLKRELGDLFFQVVFYARLAEEQEKFDFADVISTLVDKLLRRHPHVFPEGTLASAGLASGRLDEQSIGENWEHIKKQERRDKQRHSITDDIPSVFPALLRALKLQKRVSQIGFDWQDKCAVLDKVDEEMQELRDAIAEDNNKNIEEEMGDLLFTCVNLSRHLGVDPEVALRSSNSKFERRFKYIEKQMEASGQDLSDLTMDQLGVAWQRAKASEA